MNDHGPSRVDEVEQFSCGAPFKIKENGKPNADDAGDRADEPDHGVGKEALELGAFGLRP